MAANSPSPEFLQQLRYVAASGLPESHAADVQGEWERRLYAIAQDMWRDAYYTGVLKQAEISQAMLNKAVVSGAVEMALIMGREKPHP